MYLLLIALIAINSAFIYTIESNYQNSIFKKWGKFFEPDDEENPSLTAVFCAHLLKVTLYILLAIACSHKFWQLPVGWILQLVIGYLVYFIAESLFIESIFGKKKIKFNL